MKRKGKKDGFALPAGLALCASAVMLFAYLAAAGKTAPSLSGAEAVTVSGDTARTADPAADPEGVDLNRASAQELEALPGIGSTLAARIVEYRTYNGPFRSVDELTLVTGIGADKLEALRGLVTVR